MNNKRKKKKKIERQESVGALRNKIQLENSFRD
jgi:hypothetical protein